MPELPFEPTECEAFPGYSFGLVGDRDRLNLIALDNATAEQTELLALDRRGYITRAAVPPSFTILPGRDPSHLIPLAPNQQPPHPRNPDAATTAATAAVNHPTLPLAFRLHQAPSASHVALQFRPHEHGASFHNIATIDSAGSLYLWRHTDTDARRFTRYGLRFDNSGRLALAAAPADARLPPPTLAEQTALTLGDPLPRLYQFRTLLQSYSDAIATYEHHLATTLTEAATTHGSTDDDATREALHIARHWDAHHSNFFSEERDYLSPRLESLANLIDAIEQTTTAPEIDPTTDEPQDDPTDHSLTATFERLNAERPTWWNTDDQRQPTHAPDFMPAQAALTESYRAQAHASQITTPDTTQNFPLPAHWLDAALDTEASTTAQAQHTPYDPPAPLDADLNDPDDILNQP